MTPYKSMDDSQCINCRTSFQDGERLVGNSAVDFKSYTLPIKEDNIRWNITKSIVSFLNAKGGTIFLGINTNNSVV